MPAKTESPKAAAPTARRVLAFTSKLERRDRSSRLTSSQRAELKSICEDTVAYLNERIADVQAISQAGEKATAELAKIERRLATLESKEEKTEADYLTLASVERMKADYQAKAESAAEKVELANSLLNEELEGFQQQLVVSCSVDYVADIMAKAVAAVAPFCGDVPPEKVAVQLPTVQQAGRPFSDVFNPRRSGVENAQAIVSLIKKNHQIICESNTQNVGGGEGFSSWRIVCLWIGFG